MRSSIGRSHGVGAFRQMPTDAPIEFRQLQERGRQDLMAATIRTQDLQYRRKRPQRSPGYRDTHVENYDGKTFEEYMQMWDYVQEPFSWHTEDRVEWSAVNYARFDAPFRPQPRLLVTAENYQRWVAFLENKERSGNHRAISTPVINCNTHNSYGQEPFGQMLLYFREEGIPMSELFIYRDQLRVSKQWLAYLDRKHQFYHPDEIL